MLLEKQKFGDVKLIVFAGVSGSGKSTMLKNLVCHHPLYKDMPRTEIIGCPVCWDQFHPTTPLVLIDELVYAYDYWQLLRLLYRGHTVIAASHLPKISLRILGLFWRIRVISVDRDYRTIARYLDRRKISYSDAAVRDFCNALGASYIDTDIILEQYPACSFEKAWSRFRRTSRIKREMTSLFSR